MKPLSGFLEDLRADGDGLSGDALLVNQANCDLLQAWLREAETFVEENSDPFAADVIKRLLLGTTRQKD